METLFGLNSSENSSEICLLPVPWEVTVSYRGGTARGPEAILAASPQLDLFSPEFPALKDIGIYMDTHPLEKGHFIHELNEKLRPKALQVIQQRESGEPLSPEHEKILDEVNQGSHTLNDWVHLKCRKWLQQNRVVGVIGGDHSSPFGLLEAFDDSTSKNFGILHIDAHADLRNAYQGFVHSHASIMFNATNKLNNLKQLVSVGVRDYCEEEFQQYQRRTDMFLHTGYDLFKQKAMGHSWDSICKQIIDPLPEWVYVSLDIDGLDIPYGPNTGTPVPGGLSYFELFYLLQSLVKSGRRIKAFDLCEVAPDPARPQGESLDAIMGARVLYLLCGLSLP